MSVTEYSVHAYSTEVAADFVLSFLCYQYLCPVASLPECLRLEFVKLFDFGDVIRERTN
jgi:hypothetical protein